MKELTNTQLAKAIHGVQRMVDKLSGTIGKISDTVDKLARTMGNFAKETMERFDQVDETFDRIEDNVKMLKRDAFGMMTEITDMHRELSRCVTKQDLEDAIAAVKKEMMMPVHVHDDMIYGVIGYLKKLQTITKAKAERILSFYPCSLKVKSAA